MRKSPLIAAAVVSASAACWTLAQTDATPTTPPPGQMGQQGQMEPSGQMGQPGQMAGTPTTSASTRPAPTTQETLARVSYGLGFDLGRNMKQGDVTLDTTILTSGIQDALKGEKSKYSDEEMKEAFGAFQASLMEKEQAKTQAAAAKAETEGKAFLAANKDKPGVKTTASGLQYEITTEGTGPMPKATDNVKVHYTGTLIDGTKFDSSRDRGEPATFRLDEVIKGWTEGLQLLKVGSKAKLYIPPELAYGNRGAPPVIPPNATLTFDVELLSIEPPATQPAMGAGGANQMP